MNSWASCFLFFFVCFGQLPAQNIQTIAGGGPHNLDALSVGLPYPSGVAADLSGNVFFSLEGTNQIWKVDSAGRVNLFAGNGTAVNTVAGLPAANAGLSPRGLATDNAGNLYAVTYCQVVRISPSGTLTVVAGTGVYGSSGDGGPAIAARISSPAGIAVDSSGNLYIADSNNQRVRMVAANGIINTIAGTGVPGISADGGVATATNIYLPNSVAVDSSGTVYFGEAGAYRVRKFVPGGTVTTVAGSGTSGFSGDNGPATSAQISIINHIALDPAGSLYIAENFRIRKVAANQLNIVTVAGDGTANFPGENVNALMTGFWVIQDLSLL